MGRPGRPRTPLETRFWAKVQKKSENNGCWLWIGAIRHGYGQIRADGGQGAPLIASRVSWELHHGPIPDGLIVCHRCDVPACVNPEHLFLGTHSDNIRDCVAKGRKNAGGACVLGEANQNARLTEAKVREIRALRAAGLSTYEIAERVDVGQGTIWKVVARRTWRHVA